MQGFFDLSQVDTRVAFYRELRQNAADGLAPPSVSFDKIRPGCGRFGRPLLYTRIDRSTRLRVLLIRADPTVEVACVH